MKKMMKFQALALIAMSFLMAGCGSKYSDVKKMNEEFISLVENYVADLDKADNAKDAAKAVNGFADQMEDLWPKMQELSEKYPELKDKSNLPEELKETQERAEEMGKKMAESMMKLMAYMKDPEVRAAQERIGAIMMKK